MCALVLSLIPIWPQRFQCESKKEVFLTTNGIHLDIVIPKEDLSEELKKDLKLRTQAKYIAFGWGDKGFYLETPTWADLAFSTAFKAMFLKSESAMHITSYFKRYETWKKIEICPAQLNNLMVYINGSFKKNDLGRKILIPQSGYSNYDDFYIGNGSYSIFKTCNVWVNMALKKAAIQTSVWSTFDVGVLFHINGK